MQTGLQERKLLMFTLIKCSISTDNTETGYALGPPTQREAVPTSERSLHPPSCAIIRALMHSCLLWASCTNEVIILIIFYCYY